MLSKTKLYDVLIEAGIKSGDIAHVQSDLRRIGVIEGVDSSQGILNFYYNSIKDVIGIDGTISVYTMYLDYGRKGIPFDVVNTKSQSGVFSEYIRCLDGSVRSIHPIVSTCANGLKAEELCGGDHFSGHGGASPWARLHRNDAWIVSLGLGSLPGGTSFIHYIESYYGVPYLYQKVFDTPVYYNNRKLDGTFTLNVHYLDFQIEYLTMEFRKSLVDSGKALLRPLGNSDIFICKASVMVEEGIKALSMNRYAFLKNPPKFIQGKIPFDGPLY